MKPKNVKYMSSFYGGCPSRTRQEHRITSEEPVLMQIVLEVMFVSQVPQVTNRIQEDSRQSQKESRKTILQNEKSEGEEFANRP